MDLTVDEYEPLAVSNLDEIGTNIGELSEMDESCEEYQEDLEPKEEEEVFC